MTVMTQPLPRPRGVRLHLATGEYLLDPTLTLTGHVAADNLTYWTCYGPPGVVTDTAPVMTIAYLPARTAVHIPVTHVPGTGLFSFTQPP